MANIDETYPTKKNNPPMKTTTLLVNCMDTAAVNEAATKEIKSRTFVIKISLNDYLRRDEARGLRAGCFNIPNA